MRCKALAATLVAAASCVGASSVYGVSFDSPLAAEGEFELRISGRILLIIEPGDVDLELSWPGPVAGRNHTRIEARLSGPGVSGQQASDAVPLGGWNGRDILARGAATTPMSTVEIEAQEIVVKATSGALQARAGGRAPCWPNLVDPDTDHYRPWREGRCLPGGIAWRLASGSGFSVTSDSLQGLEIQGVEWLCGSVDCPPPSGPADLDGTTSSVTSMDLVARTFMVLNGTQVGSIHLNTPNLMVYGLSREADLFHDGVVRLPGFVGPGADAAGDQTLRANGTMTFSGLQATGDGSRVSGAWTPPSVVFLDEAPLVTTQKALAAIAGAGILALLAKLALALLTKTRSAPALAHPRRRVLHAFIEAHPGATFREVVRGTSIPTGTARHHIAVLKHANLIMEKPHNQTLRYFENHGRFNDSWNSVVILREPDLHALHQWLLKNPGAVQKEILEWATSKGWGRSTTQHRLKRLEAEGLVKMTPRGRWKEYTAQQRAPVPASRQG